MVASGLGVPTQLIMVVELPVVAHDPFGGLVSHGLPMGVREVHDREPAMKQSPRCGIQVCSVGALAVEPPVPKAIGKGWWWLGARIGRSESSDAAHSA